MSALLELRQVSKVYGSGPAEVQALREVDLSVGGGELVAVMGPSGSGKSTLLAIAGSLEEPTSGEVLVGGSALSGMTRNQRARLRRRQIGYVFQDFNLLAGLTALENAALPLELDGVGQRAARAAGLVALEELGLADRAGRYPDELSGGERQRVAIARAVVGDRRLLLADEPTGALDSVNGEGVMRLLRAACRRGVAGVVVTHDAQLASWADRVVFLRDGRVVDQTAPPPDAASLSPAARTREAAAGAGRGRAADGLGAGAGGQWRSPRPPGGAPLGMAAAPPGLAPAAAGAGAAQRGRGRGRLRRVGHLPPGPVGRRPVRHGQPPPRARRARPAPAGRRRRRRAGLVRHGRGDRPPGRAGPGIGRDGRAPGPGPAGPLRRAHAAAPAGPLSGHRRRGRRHRRGGRDLPGRRRQHACPRRPGAGRGRPGREPKRPGRRVRPDVAGGRRAAAVGDAAGTGQPRAGDLAAGRLRRPARVAPGMPCRAALPDPGPVREGDRRRGRARPGHGRPAAGRPDRRGWLRGGGPAPAAPAGHAGRDRRHPAPPAPGAAGRRGHRRGRRRRGRDGRRPGLLGRGRAVAGAGRRSPDRPLRPAVVAARGGHAAGRGHGHRGRLVAGKDRGPGSGHPGPVGRRRRAPFPARLALRDLARHQARSGAALAAISLALGIAVAAVVAAAAAEHTAGEGNLPDRQLLFRVGDAEPLIPERSPAELARLRSQVDRLAATLGQATVVALDAAVDPEVEEGRGGRVVRPAVMLARPVGEHTLRDVGMLFVATPELLGHLGLGRAPGAPGADVLTPHGGDLRFANLASTSEAAPDGGDGDKDAAPAIETIDVPAYTSAPVSLITHDGLRRGGWQPARAGWLVTTRDPPTDAQLARARQVAADAGMTLETRDEQPELAAVRSGATAAGTLLALGILAMTVGLIRGEAAGDLRTLTAAGATATTRRTLTAATSGALALLGVVLGAAGAYLALLAGYHNDLGALGRVPVAHLAVTLVGLPLTAAAAGWLLAGREPPALARRPLE